MFKFLTKSEINVENQLRKEINYIMQNNYLENIPLTKFANQDRCSDVCTIVQQKLETNGWQISNRKTIFGDFGDLIYGKCVSFHVFLIAVKNKKVFIVDPTFGQFGLDLVFPNSIFIHKISGETNSAKNIDICMKKLKSIGLPDKVFNFFC